jgi:hypothetical protein
MTINIMISKNYFLKKIVILILLSIVFLLNLNRILEEILNILPKKLIEEDRNFLIKINGNGQDNLNRVGKVSYLRHYVIPEQNNGKDYYVYCINSFI